METVRNTCKMLSFTRRSGSRTVQVVLCSQLPWLVMQDVIISGPSTALITSRAEMSFGWRANWYPPLEPCRHFIQTTLGKLLKDLGQQRSRNPINLRHFGGAMGTFRAMRRQMLHSDQCVVRLLRKLNTIILAGSK